MDDWKWMHHIRALSPRAFLLELFQPVDAFFYRPLSGLWHFLVWHGFQGDALPYRVVSLLALAASGWVVYRIGLHLFARMQEGGGPVQVPAFCAAVLYVTATSIHMDPMIWGVGINEHGSLLFSLLAVWLLLRGMHRRAAACFLVSLLFKESTLWFPFLAAGVAWVRRDRSRPFTSLIPAILPYLLVAGVFLALRLAGDPVTGLGAQHPYVLRLTWRGLQALGMTYASWLFMALIPMGAENAIIHQVLDRLVRPQVAGVVLAMLPVLAAGIFLWIGRGVRAARKGGLLLAAWLLLGGGLYLLLPNHVYRYYLLSALSPALLLATWMAAQALARAGLPPRLVSLVVAAWTCWAAVAGAAYFRHRCAEGLEQRFHEGTNFLIARGTAVQLAREYLQAQRPRIPRGAVLVFTGVDAWGFYKSAGPRLWLDDPELVAANLADIGLDERGWYFDRPPAQMRALFPGDRAAGRREVDAARVRMLAVEQGRVVDRTADFRRWQAMPENEAVLLQRNRPAVD